MKNYGTAFERKITLICKEYERLGIATIEKTSPPTLVAYKNKSGSGSKIPITIHLASPWLDFCGVWTGNGGWALQLEAKHTVEPRLPLGDKGLTETQIESMRRWSRAGAAVGLIWGHGEDVRVASLATLDAAIQDDRKSIRWEQASPAFQGQGLLLADFLAPLSLYYPTLTTELRM